MPPNKIWSEEEDRELFLCLLRQALAAGWTPNVSNLEVGNRTKRAVSKRWRVFRNEAGHLGGAGGGTPVASGLTATHSTSGPGLSGSGVAGPGIATQEASAAASGGTKTSRPHRPTGIIKKRGPAARRSARLPKIKNEASNGEEGEKEEENE